MRTRKNRGCCPFSASPQGPGDGHRALFAPRRCAVPASLCGYVTHFQHPVEVRARSREADRQTPASGRPGRGVLHPQVKDRLEAIETIRIETQESAVRIIDKTGPLHNPADRDHCLQYMVAVGLLKGGLTATDYAAAAAADPRIDWLRSRMVVTEDRRMSADYLDPSKRSIGNAVQVVFRGGQSTEKITVDYPIGHRRRRAEAIPLLLAKFEENVRSRLPPPMVERILA